MWIYIPDVKELSLPGSGRLVRYIAGLAVPPRHVALKQIKNTSVRYMTFHSLRLGAHTSTFFA